MTDCEKPAVASRQDEFSSRQDLERALQESRESEARLRKIVDTIPTLAWCNLPDGSNEFVNQRWCDYTGLSPEEAQRRGCKVVIHPEDLPKWLDEWRTLVASGEGGEIEARLRRHDGAYRWFLIRVEPLQDESGEIVRWYGTNTDIDDLKQTEAKLREDEREVRRITDAIPQTIVVLNQGGVPIYANQATLDYTGLAIDDVLSSDFRARIFHPEDLERLRAEREAALLRGLPFEIEQRALRKDGRYRWFLIQYKPFHDEQERLVRWYATGTDIEDRKRTEDRMRSENVALREEVERASMFEEIVGSSDALQQVLAQVSKVAPTDTTVLILGETGTGKELIARAVHKRSARSSRVFIRVNCAAIPPSLIASELFGHEKGAFTGAVQQRIGRFEAALEEMDRVIDINVRGVFVATQAALKHMTDGGRIIMIGSAAGERVVVPGLVPYSATKGAVKIFTQGLSREVGSRGITVNNVQPGPIDTDLNPAAGDWAVPQKAATALDRYGHVEEVAALVAFVAGPESSYITGSNLTVDGGMIA